MFSKIFPPIHTEGYKFLVIAVFITIILMVFSSFFGTLGLLLNVWVYYFSEDQLSKGKLRAVIQDIQVKVLYVNGIYSRNYRVWFTCF